MRNNTSFDFDLDDRCDAWGAANREAESPVSSRTGSRRLRHRALEKLVETSVIPRLLLAHHIATPLLPPARPDGPELESRVGELSEVVVQGDCDTVLAYISDLRRSAPLEVIFQDVLAPTARRLGELWNEDINDILDVTRGMALLQLIVHSFGADLSRETGEPSPDRRVLLVPIAGEQHTFGISLVSEHFRHQGWRVWSGPVQTQNETLGLVGKQWFDAVGLSASRLADPAALSDLIRELRRTSVNQRLIILVGGHAFDCSPGLVSAVGADGTGRDGREALVQISKKSEQQI